METRKIATLTGWLMVVTFVTSIPAYFILYAPVRNNPGSITGAGADPTASVVLGAVLELILIIATSARLSFRTWSSGGIAEASLWATSRRASLSAHSLPSGLSAFSRCCSCGRKERLAPTPF